MSLCECFLAIGLTLLLALTISVYLYLDKRRSYWKDRNFPCTGRARFIYGDYKGAAQTEHMQQINQRLYREFKSRKLPIGGTLLFVTPATIVLDPELIKNILVKDFANFHDRGLYHNPEVDPLTGHLFFLEGKAWYQLRAKISPTFTSGKMKMMFETVLEIANDLSKFLGENTNEAAVELEMKKVLAGFTTDVIGSCAFGIECNSLRSSKCEIREMAMKVFKLSAGQILWTMFLMTFKRLATAFKLKSIPSEVDMFFTNLVRGTIEQRERNNIHRNDFLNLFIQLKNSENPEERVTMNEIMAQAFVFFVGGYETSSTTMVNCLYELALNPEIQEKLRSEIFRVCGKEKLTYETVSSIEYLNMVIDETLRKYPSVDVLMRTSTKSYNIPDSDLKIPERTLVFIPTYAIHHDPEYYPEPERFDPERFNATNRAKRHPFVYLPFGEGPRICIGMRFGIMQTRVGLIEILRTFRVKAGANTPVPLEVEPKSGLPVPKGGVTLLIERI